MKEKFISFVKRYYLKLSELGLFILFFIIFQIVQYSFMFGMAFPMLAFFDIIFVIFIGMLIFVCRNTIFDIVWLIVWMTLFLILAIANVTYYQMSGDIFSLFNLTMMAQGTELVLDPSFYNPVFISIILVLYCLFIAGIVLLNVFKLKVEPIKKASFKKTGIVSLCMALTLGLYAGSLGLVHLTNRKDGASLKDLIITLNKIYNFKKYGTLTYYLQEIEYLISGAPLLGEEEMINYFTSEIDAKNSYTGILNKDTNVVILMIETGDDLMINETLTPNLYNLSKQGINCVNSVSKNKTNISEFIGITGSAPSAGVIGASWHEYDLPYSLTNMMNDHISYYAHPTGANPDGSNDRDIYSRKELMPKLDFDKIYFYEELFPGEDIWGWGGDYTLDSKTLPHAADMILKDADGNPFFSFITSLSMHGPYVNTYNGRILRNKYGDLLDYAIENGLWENPLAGTKNEDCIETYMLLAMDFDQGLGDLIDKFKEAGEYDNTLFVLYGDHEIYYKGADGYPLNFALSGHDSLDYADMYKTVLIFNHPDLNRRYQQINNTNEYKMLTSPYNIVPTILDLLGYDYNPNFYISPSIFAPQMISEMQIFRSLELSASFNTRLWTANGIEIQNIFVDDVSQKEIDAFLHQNDLIMERFGYIDIIITKDYFTTHDFKYYN